MHRVSNDLVIWLDALESTTQDVDEVVPLYWSLKVKKANIIICWTISRVRKDDLATEEEAEGILKIEEVFMTARWALAWRF